MTGTDVVPMTPQQELVAQVRGEQFRSQVALALPEGVKPERFVRVMATALLDNPDLAKTCEHATILSSGLKAAADGLLPDGREAAFVAFGRNAVYLPMIGGLRKIAAEYGWSLQTRVVYENDDFAYDPVEEKITHVPTRPGRERGDLVAAYAVANRNGDRLIEVMYGEDVEKVRQVSRAKDSGPWRDWPERMWEKTVGRRLFAKLPLGESDRIVRVLEASAVEPAEAAAAIYGPQARAALAPGETVDRETGEITSGADGSPADVDGGSGPAVDDRQVEGAAPKETPSPTAPSAPEDEPALETAPSEDEIAKLGETKIPNGSAKDTTLAQALATGTGEQWFGWALSQEEGFWTRTFREKLEAYAKAKGLA